MQNSQLRKPPFRRLHGGVGGPSGFTPPTVITKIQQKGYASIASASTHTVTFDTPPVQGNVMILGVVSNNIVLTGPAGWTQVASAVDNTGTYMYWKLAGAAEPSAVSVTLAASDSCTMAALEYTLLTVLDKFASATVQGTPVNMGTTAATTAANELIVCVCGVDELGSNSVDVTSWDNSLVTTLNLISTGTGVVRQVMAVKIVAATGVQTANATLSAAISGHNSGIIGTFK